MQQKRGKMTMRKRLVTLRRRHRPEPEAKDLYRLRRITDC